MKTTKVMPTQNERLLAVAVERGIKAEITLFTRLVEDDVDEELRMLRIMNHGNWLKGKFTD